MIEKQNQILSVKITNEGELLIRDKTTDGVWKSLNSGWISFITDDGLKKIPLGKPIITEQSKGIYMTFTNEKGIPFLVETAILLTDFNVKIKILRVETESYFEYIEYPAHLFMFPSGEAESYLVIPYKQGVIIPGRLDAGFMRFMHNTWHNISDIDKVLSFESCVLNMTWFGVQSHESGMFAFVETPEDSSLHVIGNAVINDNGEVVDAYHGLTKGERICSLSPIWNSSHGILGYERSMWIEPVKNGYLGMTKRYRQLVKESGKFVSLEEKVRENPNIEKMIGAPDIKIYIYTNRPNTPYYRAWSGPILDGYSRVHTTFDQVGEMVEQLKKEGVDRALILLAGWNRAGYDRQHIDMWPPAEVAGGEDGLARVAQKIKDLGYIFSLHDNYQDIYVDSPSYDEKLLMKDRNGFIRFGGIWDGGLCRLICYKKSLDLIQRTIKKVRAKVELSSYYLDTITSANLYECFDNDHPLTRKEDKEMKIRVLDYLNEDEKLIVGGEAGVDWAVRVCSFFEGLPGSSVGYFAGIDSPGFGIAVPLFNLVYHDAIICYWQHGQPFGREDHDNHFLHDLLTGQPSSWSLIYEQWKDLLPLIKQCYDILGLVHKRTAFSEMTNHRFLTNDFAVQESEFADGTKVSINYGITTYQGIPPKGFILEIPGEDKKIGYFKRLVEFKM